MADTLVVAHGDGTDAAGALAAVALAAGGRHVEARSAPPDASAAAIAAAAAAEATHVGAELVLVAHDLTGGEIAARIAAVLACACAVDVTSLRRDGDGAWVWTRGVHGGAIEAQCRCHGTVVASVDLRACGAGTTPVAAPALAVYAGADPVVVVAAGTVGGDRIEEADRIVAGGRGVGGPDGFAELARVAETVGATIAASRPPCDAGWVPSTRQVGITGAKVAPELYVAVAISGSVQHVAGMRGAGTVVAINSDPDARIFAHAHLGVVGDWRQVTADLVAALDAGRTPR